MAVEPVIVGGAEQVASEVTWIDSLLRPILQNAGYILLGFAMLVMFFIFYAIMKRREKEEDPFLMEYERVKSDLKRTAPKPKKLALNVFEPMGFFILMVLALAGVIAFWLFDITILFVYGMILMVGYGLFDKLGFFSAYTTRIYLVSDESVKFLGFHMNDMKQPKGWHDFLITPSKWVKKAEVFRVNGRGVETIRIKRKKKDPKTKKESWVEENQEVKLPINLVRREDGTIFIKGRDVRTQNYFRYVIHVDERGEPIDLDLIVAARDAKRLGSIDLIPALAEDWRNTARQIINLNPDVAKKMKVGNEGVEEDE